MSIKKFINWLLVLSLSGLFQKGIAQNVGIGTSTPADPLTVKSGSMGLGITQETADKSVRIGFFTSVSSGAFLQTHTNHDLNFSTNNDAAQMVLQKNSGNVGIGTLNPLRGGLVVDRKVGAVHALFGSNTTGIAIESDFPGIGFNSYFSSGRRLIGEGFGALISLNPTNGNLSFFNTSISGAIGQTPTMFTRFLINKDGNIGIQGNTNPGAPLSFSNTVGNKISLWGDPTTGHYGIGIQGSLLQLYTGGLNDDIVFGHGRSSAFVENVRMKGNGNLGIGTNNPTSRLTVFGNASGFEHTNGTASLRTQLFSNNLLAIVGTTTNTNLSLQANNGNNGGEIRILTNGNVGVGTISPTVKLDVNGWSRFSQKMIINQHIGSGDGEALELVGGIKTSGIYKFAFRVDMGTLSGNPKFFQVSNIDYYNITTPLIANNPDAIVVATPLSTSLSFPFWMGYDATNTIGGGTGQWYLAQPRSSGAGGFVNGARFNVIVVK